MTDLTLDAQIRGEKEVRPWDAFWWKALDQIVAFFPSYRETREGRSKKKQMQVVVLVLGFGFMALGGQAQQAGGLWIMFGVFIASSAFVVPVEENKKRTWRGKFKKKQRPRKRAIWEDGSVVYDGSRIELRRNEKKIRHVKVDRNKHEVTVRHQGDRLCLGILPPGAKKDSSIWICASGPVEQVSEPERAVNSGEMDSPAKIGAEDWKRLWEVLKEQS